jgi:winged helix-turn helix protein
MRGRKPRDLALGAEDAAALRQVARCQSLPWFQVRRARTVLAVAGGERIDVVAHRLECDRATIWRTCRLYEERGMDGLMAAPDRSGRPERLSPPGAGEDRAACLPGAGRPWAAHHPLVQ